MSVDPSSSAPLNPASGAPPRACGLHHTSSAMPRPPFGLPFRCTSITLTQSRVVPVPTARTIASASFAHLSVAFG
jgi:hypothetical protein